MITGSGDGVEKIVIESVTDNTTELSYYCVEGGKVSDPSVTSHSSGTDALFTSTLLD